VRAANAVLRETGDETKAVQACIHAAGRSTRKELRKMSLKDKLKKLLSEEEAPMFNVTVTNSTGDTWTTEATNASDYIIKWDDIEWEGQSKTIIADGSDNGPSNDGDDEYSPAVLPFGPKNAPVAFISARASETDEIRGLPMCGPTGETLRDIYLKKLGLERKQALLMAYVPKHLTEEDGSPRDPDDEDIEYWRPWVTKQLDEYAPQRVVALGRDARRALGDLADEWLPHPLAVRAYGDSGEVGRKLERVRKSMKEGIRKQFNVSICKQLEEKQIVYGVVLEPDVEDAHGDIFPQAVIEDAAHNFMRDSQVLGVMHVDHAGAEIVESFIAPTDLIMGGQSVREGSWIMGMHISDGELWQAVKGGAFTGFSVGAIGRRVPL
jgi:uracil-DNA glycosylase